MKFIILQGPSVECDNELLTGIPALVMLLRQAHVIDHIMMTLSMYHPYTEIKTAPTLLSPGTKTPDIFRDSLHTSDGKLNFCLLKDKLV